MSRKAMLLPLIGLGVVGLVTFAAWADDENEKEVKLDQVPAAVKATIEKKSEGAKITEIEREMREGQMVYEVEWTKDGMEHELTLTADGDVIAMEKEIPAEEVPAAVMKTAKSYFGANAKVEVEQKIIVIYEVEGKIDGKEKELLVFPTGKIHEDRQMKHDDDDDHDDDGDDDDDDDD